ncbi:MAG: imelysin family protein [Pseudomonadota bacterium]
MKRSFVLLACLLGLSLPAGADPTNFSASAFMQAVHRAWGLPHAAAFVRESALLAPALRTACAAAPDQAGTALDAARTQWQATLASWEGLSAVAFGPVLERRSQRQIDFIPTRARMIEKAIQATPASLKDLELVGTPAKGLPALEWLLWVKPVAPGSAACAYALLLADEVAQEAGALESAYRTLAATPLPQAAAEAAFAELVNQWVGGIGRLSWEHLAMPVRVARTSQTPTAPVFPRNASASIASVWDPAWSSLRDLAAGTDFALDQALATRGHAAVAADFARAVRGADAAMRGISPKETDRVLAAGEQLAALKQQFENQVAPALGVAIGFSDADGD